MVEQLIVRLIGDGSSYANMLKAASNQATMLEKKVSQVSAGLSRAGAAASRAGRTLTAGITAPVVGVGAAAINEFGKFDQAMTKSTAIMTNLSDESAKQMESVALNLSTTSLQGPTELAEAYFFLASAGLDAKQSIAALPAVSQFATAGAFNMATATDLLTDAQSALGMTVADAGENLKNMTRLSDLLVGSNTLANASVQQFSEALTTDAGTASKEFGASLETTLALLSLYADKGKKGAEAGSLFGRATRLMTKAARENADVFEAKGIKVIDEATGEYRNFIDILDDMNVAFQNLSGPQRSAALDQLGFATLAQKSILPLLGATEQLKTYESQLISMGAVTETVATKQMQAFFNQMTLLKNQATVLAIQLGQALAPTVLKVSQFVLGLRTSFASLSPETQTFIARAIALTAALGPVLIVTGFLLSSLSTLVSVVSVVVGVIGGFIASTTALVAIVVAGAVALRVYTGSWSSAAQVVGNAIDFMVDVITVGLRIIMRSVRVVAGWLVGAFQNIWSHDFVGAVISGIRMAAQKVVDFGRWVTAKLRSFFTGSETGTIQDFIAELQGDFQQGANSEDILGTLAQIGKEEFAALQARRQGKQILPGNGQVPEVAKQVSEQSSDAMDSVATTVKELLAVTKTQLDKTPLEVLPLNLAGR